MARERTGTAAVILSAYLPTLLFSAAEGTIIPIVPAVAGELGADLALAGFIASLTMVGKLLGDIPSGWLTARLGERRAMLGASLVTVLAIVLCLLAPHPGVLGVGVVLLGLAESTFGVARHAFMTVFVPIRYRARALSTLGGTLRAGWAVGPFLSAGVLTLFGHASSVFWLALVFCAATVVVILLVPEPERLAGMRPASRTRADASVVVAVRQNWPKLWRLGSSAAILSGLRGARQVIVPLWAVSLGLDPAATALIVGIAGAVDFLLFYPSGQIMDRFGRFWACVPPSIGLGLCYIVLAFTHDLAGATVWFIAIAMALAAANGLSSGVLMTLGADLAPQDRPAPFLGAWRFSADVGAAGLPLLISAITAVATLGVASVAVGVIGFLGAAGFWRYLPAYVASPRARREALARAEDGEPGAPGA